MAAIGYVRVSAERKLNDVASFQPTPISPGLFAFGANLNQQARSLGIDEMPNLQ